MVVQFGAPYEILLLDDESQNGTLWLPSSLQETDPLLRLVARPTWGVVEPRIARKTSRAIAEFALVEDDDRVMVGLSGGKESAAADARRAAAAVTGAVLANCRQRQLGLQGTTGIIAKMCRERGWEYRLEHTAIHDVRDDILDADAMPCLLCAWLRRGVLY